MTFFDQPLSVQLRACHQGAASCDRRVHYGEAW